MNKIMNIVFTFLAVLLASFVAMVDDVPGDFGGGDNPADTLLDTFICLLAVVGLRLVFYIYRNVMK